MRGRGCAVSADIEQFYDNIDVLAVVQRLGLKYTSLTRAIMAHHLRVGIHVGCKGSLTSLGLRTGGCLAGSRTAVAVECELVHDVLHEVYSQVKPLGFGLGYPPTPHWWPWCMWMVSLRSDRTRRARRPV